jgi:hypothetical protein
MHRRDILVTTTNVGMTTKLITWVMLLEPMLELKVVYDNVNNGYSNAYIIQRGKTCSSMCYSWIDMECNS